jgi:hypothetical protein
MYRYLYGIVIVVGAVDSVDKMILPPPVGRLPRFIPDLAFAPVF